MLILFHITGPFAWSSLFNFRIAINIFFLWALFFTIYNFKAIKRLEQEEAART
jgi:hypothetical protein